MGASVAVGPLLVALFYDSFGQEGMVWLFTGCYGLAALLTLAFHPTDERTRTGDKIKLEEKNLVSTLSTRGTSKHVARQPRMKIT